MNRLLRHLRIGFGVVCGFLSICFATLWVCSYSKASVLNVHLTHSYGCSLVSQRGYIGSVHYKPAESFSSPAGFSTCDPERLAEPTWNFAIGAKFNRYLQVMVPWWFVLATIWIVWIGVGWQGQWRFCVRTLLITTTIIGVVLGTIVSTLR